MKKRFEEKQMTIFDDGLIEDEVEETPNEPLTHDPDGTVEAEPDDREEKQEQEKEEKKRKKPFSRIFKDRRGLLAGLCLLAAALVCFVAVPLWTAASNRQVPVVRVRSFLSEGTRITRESVETVRVSGNALPDGTIRNEALVIGRIANADLFPGDFIQTAKIREGNEENDPSSLQIREGRIAVSVPLSGSASTLASGLRRGDVVSVFCFDPDEGIAFIPEELRALRVISLSGNQGQMITDETPGTPSSITLLLNEIQGARIFELEKNCEIRFALICQAADASRASALLASQQNFFEGS